jgi:hypothetical protein
MLSVVCIEVIYNNRDLCIFYRTICHTEGEFCSYGLTDMFIEHFTQLTIKFLPLCIEVMLQLTACLRS